MNKRPDGRKFLELRPITYKKGYIPHAEGSCMFEMGKTKVLCVASVEEKVPPFLVGSGNGWITADYAMLPRACQDRTPRNRQIQGGRSQEIKRIIGRALRGVVDLSLIGERSITLDCDVILADAGTRTASINGSYIALTQAIGWMMKNSIINKSPLIDTVGAVSVGMIGPKPLLDLCYEEDKNVRMDLNVVMTGSGKFIEVQGTAEGEPCSRKEIDTLLSVAHDGIKKIIKKIKQDI
ncbi:MAG: ribonuclease PH [Elusimicrobia bacterium]|nr:ribonuclease PH [Elusimicrobiota bacterium]MBD3412160.1 ribonuclease PH [Elusimicrobiota bacterium]